MRTNQALRGPVTYEGGAAVPNTPISELRRAVLSCLLWENSFYESGESVADRIKRLVPDCRPDDVILLAAEARGKYRLRHVPLLLARELARYPERCEPGAVAWAIENVIQRADELAEFVALYWKDGKVPLSSQVKKGLSRAFLKFEEYALAKYDRAGQVRLRDVLFLVHPKPDTKEREQLWKRLADGELRTPDTWEVALSAGADKKETFERLITEGKLGYLALLRNLRKMRSVGVDQAIVENALISGARKSKALPFRFLAAARAVPDWEPMIETAMMQAMSDMPMLGGETVLLVDVSGSMSGRMSGKSDLSSIDAACALAVLTREVIAQCHVYAFNTRVIEIPPRHGMALVDSIRQHLGGGTYLGKAVKGVKERHPHMARLVVITDEQSHDTVFSPGCDGYMINVASYKNGVGYGDWVRINGFSEAVLQFITEVESSNR